MFGDRLGPVPSAPTLDRPESRTVPSHLVQPIRIYHHTRSRNPLPGDTGMWDKGGKKKNNHCFLIISSDSSLH